MIYRQNFTFYQKKTGFASFPGGLAWLVVSVIGLCLACHSSAFAQTALPLKPAHETVFPTETLATKDGTNFSIADHDGALIVNFWASWCAPCVHELPDLAEASRAFKAADIAISVALISVDRKGHDHAQNFLDELGIADVISAYNPESTWARALGVRGLPSTYLISADRDKIFLIQGPAAWADEAVMAEIVDAIYD